MNNNLKGINSQELMSNLRQFTGTSSYYRYSALFPYFLLTDGTRYLAEEAQCFWLMDFIASNQLNALIRKNQSLQQIQFWQLRVKDNQAKVWVEEDKDKPVLEEILEYTDFPLERLTLYVQPIELEFDGNRSWVCLLPSEY